MLTWEGQGQTGKLTPILWQHLSLWWWCPLCMFPLDKEENFLLKSVNSICTSLMVWGLSQNECACLPAWGEKGVWRQVLLLCKSCTKCQECSSLFARGPQFPTQGWQLGLFGENYVGWVFGVGSVATAGMMQELKMQTRGTWSLTVMLNMSLSRITASVRTVRLGNRDFNQRIFTDVSKLPQMVGYCGHSSSLL